MDAPRPTMHDFVEPFRKVEARWRVYIYLDMPRGRNQTSENDTSTNGKVGHNLFRSSILTKYMAWKKKCKLEGLVEWAMIISYYVSSYFLYII